MEKETSFRGIRSAYLSWLTAAAFVVFGLAFGLYVDAEKKIDSAHALRFESFLLADELRQSSDDLTRMVRTYVVTNDVHYKQRYQEILDIRDGKEPRPLAYDNVYWDLVMQDNQRPRDFARALPLLTLMSSSGFTKPEFAKLAQAKAASDTLTKTEFASMALVESVRAPNANQRVQAIGMLHDEAYHQAKAGIMQPIGDFREMVDHRTLAAVRTAETNADRVRLAFLLFGVVLALCLWRLLQTLHQEKKQKAEQEERWKYALEGSGAGVWDWDIRSGGMTFTRQWKSMLGYGDEELGVGAEVWEALVHPGDLAEAKTAVSNYFNGEATDCVFEHRLKCKDGSWKWILSRGMVVSRDKAGKPMRMIGTHTDITLRKENELSVNFMAYHDKLTGLPNRALFFDRFSQTISLSRRNSKKVALLFLDLDGFKAVNDQFGHDAGNIVLKAVSKRLVSAVRAADTVARIGGDEFVMVLGELGNSDNVTMIAQKVIDSVKGAITLSGHQKCHVEASIGISIYPENGTEMDTLLTAADSAMYRSKGNGRGRYTYSDETQIVPPSQEDWAQLDDAHFVGVQEIDEQHQRMAALLNGLNAAIRENADSSTLKRLFEELLEYSKYHFKSEQVLMDRYSYPGAKGHALAHGNLQAEAPQFRTRLRKGGDLFVLQSIKDWFLDHITVEDKPLGHFLHDQGVS